MSEPEAHSADPRLIAVLHRCAAFASIFAIALPALVLVGWTFEIGALKSILPGLVAMNPATAVCFILAGSALAMRLREGAGGWFARLCALAVVAAGVLVLGCYALGRPPWIDRLLFTARLGGNVMAPTTAFAFILTGSAIGVLEVRTAGGRFPTQLLAALVALVALLALTGYAYQVEKFYKIGAFIAMAVHTAATFLVLSLGVLCARPERDVMARFCGAGPGGAMLRRLLVAIIGVPFAIGWLITWCYRAWSMDTAFGFTIFVVAVVVFVATMIWRNAVSLDLEDAERTRAEAGLHRAQEGLETTVAERTAELRQVIEALAESVNILTTSSQQILATTSHLAATAGQSAASVAETTATVAELRQTVEARTAEAQGVAAAAQQAAEISRAGESATEATAAGMQRLRDEMQAIAESMLRLSAQGRAIGEIVAAVDDLAAQSSLLAVNAAIQAARAREHGKGFAVVAEQVKYLAGQSREATKQVRTILGDIQQATGAAMLRTEQAAKSVETGVRESADAGQSIVTLSAQVEDAAAVARQIAHSSREQLAGMDDVARAMNQIQDASRQNAGQAKELEQAARNLHALGQRMKRFVDRHHNGSAP